MGQSAEAQAHAATVAALQGNWELSIAIRQPLTQGGQVP